MVKYNSEEKSVDVAYGSYKSADVEIFRNDGFVDVEEGLSYAFSLINII